MSLTVLYRSKKIRFIYSVSKNQLLAIAALCCVVVFVFSGNDDHTLKATENVAYTQSGLVMQRQEVEQLKLQTQDKLTGMMLKLGEMQGQLQRLNALGEKLASESDLNIDEFRFNEELAIGGPVSNDELPRVDTSHDILVRIDQMLNELDNKTEQLEVLESILLNHHISDESFISGKPIESGWLSSYYGVRKDPFSGMPAMHKGLDFAGQEGAPVVATGAGIVTWADSRYGYGNLVEIDHGNGLITRYGHNHSLHVKIGDVVTKGQLIADMGHTGRATGAHVHYEVLQNGRQIDPLKFVYRKAVN
ncbi:MAG: M23 family metallopeptidase [Aestuariibacter sp.]